MPNRNKIRVILVTIVLFGLFTLIICNKIIKDYSNEKTFSNAKDIPYNRIGLLLGTSREIKNGQKNPFYFNRIQAASQLLKIGKIKYIIVSGDNSRKDYDETSSMRNDLIKEGIDSSVIFLDYAGFRTFDSMKRLKEIFSQDSVTVISQQFHNERAIYIASKLGIYALGFNAKNVGENGMRTNIREKFARVKVFIDFWFGKKPKFLGQKVNIPV